MQLLTHLPCKSRALQGTHLLRQLPPQLQAHHHQTHLHPELSMEGQTYVSDQLLDSPCDTPSVLQLQPAQTALIPTPPDPLPSSSPPGANGCQPLVTSGKPDSSLSLPISSHALSPPGPQAPGCLSSISTASPDSPASLPRSQELLLLPIPFAPAAILGSTDLTRELPYLKICYGVLLLQNEGHSQATQALLGVATSRPAPLAGMPVRVSHVPCVQAPCSLPSGDRLHFLPPGLCSCQNDTSAET